MQCDRDSCPEPATHGVRISFPGEQEEAWQVCRAHDRDLKCTFVARPRHLSLDPIPAPESGPAVHCGQCDRALGEPTDLAAELRQPCPQCGSTSRHVRVMLADAGIAHEGLRVRSRRPGQGGWLKETKSGDDYTRDLDVWGHRTLEKDREHDHYRELLKLPDGSWLESTAKLSDHHD
jgi:hypothetical protein